MKLYTLQGFTIDSAYTPTLGATWFERQVKHVKNAGKSFLKRSINVLDKTGDLAYQYTGLKALADISEKTFNQVKKAMLQWVREKLLQKYGDTIIKKGEPEVQAYVFSISTPLIAYVDTITGGLGIGIVPPLLAGVVHSVFNELRNTLKNQGRKITKSAEKYFDELYNDAEKFGKILADNTSEQEKQIMAEKIAAAKAEAADRIRYTMAQGGIPTPNKIVSVEIQTPYGKTAQTQVTWYSIGKTVNSPLAPDEYLKRFKMNNPGFDSLVLQPNGTVISIQPVAPSGKAQIQALYSQGYGRKAELSDYGMDQKTDVRPAAMKKETPEKSSFIPLAVGAGILLSLLG